MGVYELKKTTSGDGFVFNLKASNGEVVATSQTYTTEQACIGGIKSVATNAPVAPVEDQTKENYTTEKNPKFEVYKDKAGEFRFRLNATNGQTICHGQGYSTKENCLKGIESIRKNSGSEIKKI